MCCGGRLPFSRDKLGRITQKVETVAGLSATSDYTYDLAGRLDTVSVDGALIADYAYDSNSNRVGVMQVGSGMPSSGCAANLANVSANVDAQDRLLTYGTCQYQYTDNGELSHKTDTATSAVTTYQYDSFSNLRHVNLPDGRAIDYQIDGRNRRIGKSINGVAVQGLIYINDLEEKGSGLVLTHHHSLFGIASGSPSRARPSPTTTTTTCAA